LLGVRGRMGTPRALPAQILVDAGAAHVKRKMRKSE
jgi:hypothetical protein